MQYEIICPDVSFAIYAPYAPKGKWNGDDFLTLLPLVYYVNGEIYEIPAGFKTDLGSIPAKLRSLARSNDQKTILYLIHDWFYKKHKGTFTKRQADLILYHGLRSIGESWYTSNKIYYGVRVGTLVTPYQAEEAVVDTDFLKGVLTHLNTANRWLLN
jgi:hypothetical protein